MRDLLLFPAGGNAREAVGVAQALGDGERGWRLLGFVDDDPGLAGGGFYGVPVLGGRAVLTAHPQTLVLAVPGSPSTYRKRLEIIASLGLAEDRFATLVHPTAQLGPGVRVGRNCLIMAGVVLTAGVTMGDHCLVMPNTVISHEAQVGTGCMIGSNVSISGGARLQEICYIGSGSRLIQDVSIGAGALVGLGSTVIRDVPPGSVVAGTPARVLG